MFSKCFSKIGLSTLRYFRISTKFLLSSVCPRKNVFDFPHRMIVSIITRIISLFRETVWSYRLDICLSTPLDFPSITFMKFSMKFSMAIRAEPWVLFLSVCRLISFPALLQSLIVVLPKDLSLEESLFGQKKRQGAQYTQSPLSEYLSHALSLNHSGCALRFEVPISLKTKCWTLSPILVQDNHKTNKSNVENWQTPRPP